MKMQNILSYFREVKKCGKRYMALCPAHHDHNPSLCISLSDDGKKILIHCFAGCTTKEILRKVGLDMEDLHIEDNVITKKQVNKQTYDYMDVSGSLLYRKTRIDYDDRSKEFYFSQPDGTKGVKDVQRVPYNLPAVMNSQIVYFVEGEKCADAVIKAGRTATTLDSGANSRWLPEYNSYFDGKTVIVIPDNDKPGNDYARRIAEKIPGSRVVKLPDLLEKGDVYDWLSSGHTMDELDKLPSLPLDEDLPDKIKISGITQFEKLLGLIERNMIKLFKNETNDPYISLSVDNHQEIWSIKSTEFKSWLYQLYYDETGKSAKRDTVSDVTEVMAARAMYIRQESVTLAARVAENNGAFWYDLTNQKWQAIKITADGWTLEDIPPLLFYRYRHQKPQEKPKQGGDINLILNYVNLKENQILFLCWLVCSFIPNIPHSMLIFFGEKGASKSTTFGFLKQLIDPSVLDTLTLPNIGSLIINLRQHWFLDFDNISHISEEVSDTLCRAVTGGGIQQRKLFTDAEDVIFKFQRCISINGINNVVTRSDLLDRSILMELERIPEERRRELKEIQSEFKKDLPYILGGVLDTLSKAMAIFPTVKLDKLPRMADFARWGYAVGEALGGKGAEFLSEYTANIQLQSIEVVNSDVVATLLIAFMENRQSWEGRASDLLQHLSAIAPKLGVNPRLKAFPAQPNVLTRRLNALKSNLEMAGIFFERRNKTTGTFLTVINTKLSPLPPYYHKDGDNGDNGDKKEAVQ